MTTNFKELKKLSTFCKINKIKHLKVGDIELEFAPEGLVTASEKKQIMNLLKPGPKSEDEIRREYESDLFYSAS